jgi:hypothetical protein
MFSNTLEIDLIKLFQMKHAAPLRDDMGYVRNRASQLLNVPLKVAAGYVERVQPPFSFDLDGICFVTRQRTSLSSPQQIYKLASLATFLTVKRAQ